VDGMINVNLLNKEIKKFMVFAITVMDGDIELENRLQYELENLMNSYRHGEALIASEYEAAIDAITEFAELADFETKELMFTDYPEILKILAFQKRKVNWKRQK
jgi:hypothetical protein